MEKRADAPLAEEDPEEVFEEDHVEAEPENCEDDDIIEIDTDQHFGRENTGKVQKEPVKKVEVKDDFDDEYLYDLC